MRLIYKRILQLFSVAVILAMVGCTQNVHMSEAKIAFLKSVEGQPGIIGSVDFQGFGAHDALQKIVDITGAVLVYNEETDNLVSGNGILVMISGDPSVYLLTAKHVIYDIETLKIRGNVGYFVYQENTRDKIMLELQLLPKRVKSYGISNDAILIPIDLPTNQKLSPMILSQSSSPQSYKNIYSIGMIATDEGPIKTYQKDIILKRQSLKHISKIWGTDADVLHGMSGSAVVGLLPDGSFQLFGIITFAKKTKNCKMFSEACRNFVTPIDVSLLIDDA